MCMKCKLVHSLEKGSDRVDGIRLSQDESRLALELYMDFGCFLQRIAEWTCAAGSGPMVDWSDEDVDRAVRDASERVRGNRPGDTKVTGDDKRKILAEMYAWGIRKLGRHEMLSELWQE